MTSYEQRLYEALKELVERVERLSLWDKVDQSYYRAKTLIQEYEQKNQLDKLPRK